MATYTSDQVDAYLGHIGFPRDKHPGDPLALLTGLQQRHVGRVPFDSVALHYSPHRLLSLDPGDLLDKIVTRGRGGYCMEVNTLFAAVLRGLGFDVYSAGGRVKHERWNHMVNLVTIGETKYLVDVGYGRGGPTQPVPLTPRGFEFAGIVAPARGKLERKTLARHHRHDHHDQSVWVYSVWTTTTTTTTTTGSPPPEGRWEDQYSFAEVEFFPEDFEVVNWHVMTRPQSYFVQTVLAYRAVWDEEAGRLVGEVVLHKDALRRVLLPPRGGRPGQEPEETLVELRSEEDRVAALEEHFWISLTEREREAIRGLASELKAR